MKLFLAVWTSWNTTLFGFVPYASFTVHVMTSRCIVMFSVSIWMASISYSNSLFLFQWCQGTQLSSLTPNTWIRLHICPAVYGCLIWNLIFGMKNCILNSCTVYCKLCWNNLLLKMLKVSVWSQLNMNTYSQWMKPDFCQTHTSLRHYHNLVHISSYQSH
jgi:hypothetical protein